MKSPEEARKAWVEALRSPEYLQGRNRLHANGRFCCLGVACKLAVEDGVPVEVYKGQGGATFYDGNVGALPGRVREWLGLADDYGAYVARNGVSTDLATRNDGGASFRRIADIIESEPKGLIA